MRRQAVAVLRARKGDDPSQFYARGTQAGAEVAQSNGDGSDHGWGAHHLVVGGAVKRRDIYGQFPVVALGTNEDVGHGRLIPTTSVDQYAARFARWMGLSDAQLSDVLPNLQYFSPTTLPLFV